jgi:hypothetical protein
MNMSKTGWIIITGRRRTKCLNGRWAVVGDLGTDGQLFEATKKKLFLLLLRIIIIIPLAWSKIIFERVTYSTERVTYSTNEETEWCCVWGTFSATPPAPVRVVTAYLSNTSLAYLHPVMFKDLFKTLDAFLISSLAASSEHFIVLLTFVRVQLQVALCVIFPSLL